MSFGEFFKDKLPLLLMQAGCALALFLFLRATGYSKDASGLILLCWALLLAGRLAYEYVKRKRYFEEMERILEQTEKRYLLGELMPDSGCLEDRLYRAMIRRANKSVIERIRKAEDEQREYREYIESWVHEIKAPITAIALQCENHKTSLTRQIAAENQRVENLVNMVLYYARSDQVYKDYMISKVSLQEIVEETVGRNKYTLIQNSVRVEADCEEEAYTDRKWLEFILNQLLLNCVKYKAGEGAVIRLYTTKEQNGICLIVEDNGAGIKEEELPRIFEKGFTGSNGRKEKHSTGMGLYLCQKLCKKLGISICAESREGKGTRIILGFPISTYLSNL